MRAFILLFLLISTMVCTQQCYAAFPVHATSGKTEKRSFDEFINATIEKYNLPVPPYNGESADNPALSITALALAIGGFAFLILALELLAAVWLIPAGLLGIASIILGAMGSRRRPLRGLGIAGMVLGIIDVSILLVVGFFALIFAAFTGQL